jgi:hypothetical protein
VRAQATGAFAKVRDRAIIEQYITLGGVEYELLGMGYHHGEESDSGECTHALSVTCARAVCVCVCVCVCVVACVRTVIALLIVKRIDAI